MGRTISQWIYLGGVKAFFDGSLGSNSALLYEVRKIFIVGVLVLRRVVV